MGGSDSWGGWSWFLGWRVSIPGVEGLDSWGGGLWRMPWTSPEAPLDVLRAGYWILQLTSLLGRVDSIRIL